MGKPRFLLSACCLLTVLLIHFIFLFVTNGRLSPASSSALEGKTQYLPLIYKASLKNTPPRIQPRSGIAPDNFEQIAPQISQIADWSYRWSAYDGDYPTTNEHELVPMLVFSKKVPSIDVIRSIDIKTDLNTGHDYWLVFNECEAWVQCDTPAEEQAVYFYEEVLPLINSGDPDAKLIVGGVIANEKGLTWLTTFVQTYRQISGHDLPRAGWHFHIYPEVKGTPPTIDSFVADAESFRHWVDQHGSPNDEIWLTVMGCLSTELCSDVPTYLAEILAYLNGENGRWITRYAWYTSYSKTDCNACSYNPSTFLIEENTPHGLTPLGQFYANHLPEPAILPRPLAE